MDKILIAALVALGLFFGILILLEVGRRLGEHRLADDPEGARNGIGAVEGVIFGLVGLLIAFTFSGAANRFDERRALVVQEANAIGTAYLRLDLLPEGAQPALRDLFRRYLDARIETYRRLPDFAAAKATLQESIRVQNEIWSQALAAGKGEGASPDAVKLLVPALNEMIDITTTRTTATAMHPPPVIYLMLVVLTLAASLMAGYGMAGAKKRSWTHMLGFAVVMSLAVYLIVDLEYPRLGLIRVQTFDRTLVDLRADMG
jgi:hypothetical protein